MKIDDFRYMRRGKQLQTLSDQDAKLLAPINLRRKGNGHALLLLHGFSSSPAVFRELMPAFAKYDAVIAPALPGHGDSVESFAKSLALQWLSNSEEVCAELVKDYQKVDVMGLSLGGLLACHLSTKFSLNHLYLLAPAFALKLNITTALRGALFLRKLGFKLLRNRAGNLYTDRFSELAYRRLPLAAIIEVLTLVNTFKFTPPTCPVDVFLGRFDEVVDSNAIAKRFADLPNVNIHWLQNSAHVLPLDGDIEQISACVNDNLLGNSAD